DPGTFDLKVGSTVVKAAAGDGGAGTIKVVPGSYTVSEVAAFDSGTELANYVSSVSCTLNGNPGPAGNGTSLGVTVAAADVLACTIRNTNPRKATVTLRKHLLPSFDPGRFDLIVGGVVVRPAAGDGAFGSLDVAPGGYRVEEFGAG